MCCGQKRSQFQTSQARMTAPSAHQQPSGHNQGQAVRAQSSPQATAAVPPRFDSSWQLGGFQPPKDSAPNLSVVIRYLETSLIRVKGLITGRVYEFSGAQALQSIDARDASSLLNTRFFRRV
jgi:hypothetical protein